MAETTAKSISRFQGKLIKWYKEHGRTFPWRKNNLSQYQLIIAEVLLQRTKAETVSNFYKDFIAAFPDWKSLADSDTTIIAEYLKPIGLQNQRAARLKKLAQEMVRRRGFLPRDRPELDTIPLFGQYIANAIELLIFKKPSPLLDVNMARVLERYFGERKLADIRYDPYLQDLALNVSIHAESKTVNWAILDFAALICKAQRPQCETCFLSKQCTYFNQ